MSSQQHYKVNLSVFEGPLDLLLYLVRKNDLNIYEIPISFITEEYLKYLEVLEEFNIDVAGDFLAMAAELMLMKSRILLPQEITEGEEEGEDPQAELARRLIEYQKFKLAASQLLARPMLGREIFKRAESVAVGMVEQDSPLKGDVSQLVVAFSEILKKIPKELYHEVAIDRIGLNVRIQQLIEILNQKSTLLLTELLPEKLTRYDLVITFLSLLEMTRMKMVCIHQDGEFGQIAIRRAMSVLTTLADIETLEEYRHG